MKEILYVDSCVNRDKSRTERLAQALLARLTGPDVHVQTLVLEDEHLVPLDGPTLNRRSAGVLAHDYGDPVFDYPKQFAAADEVVFAAPYWDFSFPSMLKIYLERLCAQGVTFLYSDEGEASGLCKASRVWYVTTSGNYIGDYDFGFEQVKAICSQFFDIKDIRSFRAEGLDIASNDIDAIMDEALARIRDAEL